MDRKRIAVIAGTITGTLALASAAGAANFGLLRAADEDPAPSVGNLDAGNSSSSSSSDSVPSSIAVGNTTVSSVSSVPSSSVTSVAASVASTPDVTTGTSPAGSAPVVVDAVVSGDDGRATRRGARSAAGR